MIFKKKEDSVCVCMCVCVMNAHIHVGALGARAKGNFEPPKCW